METNLEELGRAVKQVQHRQHRAADTALGVIGTTLVQWDALRAIGARPGASAHELAQATFQTDQAFGTLANRLEARRLIERRAGHGRRVDHRLTPEGLRMLAAANRVVDRVRQELFAPLDGPDRQALLTILAKLLVDAAEDDAAETRSDIASAGSGAL